MVFNCDDGGMKGKIDFCVQQNNAKQIQLSFLGQKNVLTVVRCIDLAILHSNEVNNSQNLGTMLANHDANL